MFQKCYNKFADFKAISAALLMKSDLFLASEMHIAICSSFIGVPPGLRIEDILSPTDTIVNTDVLNDSSSSVGSANKYLL